jgi:hypothetical protein
LSQYIDPTYLSTEAMTEINELFQDESSVQLQKFFLPKYQEPLLQAMKQEDGKDQKVAPKKDSYDYRRGVSTEWKLVGPPHKQRFLEYQPANTTETAEPDGKSVGAILSKLKHEVLESPAFARFLQVATSLSTPTASRGCIRRFRPGSDYTVAHHGLLLANNAPPVLDATLCFVLDDHEDGDNASKKDNSVHAEKKEGVENGDKNSDNEQEDDGEQEDATWESGNVGGFEAYIEADDDEDNSDKKTNDPAEEYNEDDDTPLLSVSASSNTLSLVLRDAGTMRFVKYVGARAPSSRWDIAMEYQVPDDGDDEHEKEDGPDNSEAKSSGENR